jgi:hypothetical protein
VGDQLFVCPDHGVAGGDDIGLVEPVDGLTCSLEESTGQIHAVVAGGQFIELQRASSWARSMGMARSMVAAERAGQLSHAPGVEFEIADQRVRRMVVLQGCGVG